MVARLTIAKASELIYKYLVIFPGDAEEELKLLKVLICNH